MGTLYRIVDHKNKLFYDMDRWVVWPEVLTSVEELTAHLVTGPAERNEPKWIIDMGAAVVRDVSKHMEFPLDRAYDCEDEYHDVEDEGYTYCGDRFCSHVNINTPYDSKPDVVGEYATWLCNPFNYGMPDSTRMYWNGAQWKSTDSDDWGLASDVPVWWTPLDNSDITERLK